MNDREDRRGGEGVEQGGRERGREGGREGLPCRRSRAWIHHSGVSAMLLAEPVAASPLFMAKALRPVCPRLRRVEDVPCLVDLEKERGSQGGGGGAALPGIGWACRFVRWRGEGSEQIRHICAFL